MKKFSLVIFIIGILALLGGGGFLAYKFLGSTNTADADFLISASAWTKDGEPSVVWQFTEIGKGTLTTNNHTNDYDFIWALDGNKLKIETAWLYNLENEYTYSLDQSGKTLSLTANNQTITFVAE